MTSSDSRSAASGQAGLRAGDGGGPLGTPPSLQGLGTAVRAGRGGWAGDTAAKAPGPGPQGNSCFSPTSRPEIKFNYRKVGPAHISSATGQAAIRNLVARLHCACAHPNPCSSTSVPGAGSQTQAPGLGGRGCGGLKGRGAEHHALFQALRAARTYWLRRARPPGDTGEPPGQAWLLCNEVVHSRVTTRARTVDVGNTAQSLPQTSPH